MTDAANRVCAVTGAHGYLGSRLCRALSNDGWSILSLSRRAPAGKGELSWSLESCDSIAAEFRARSVSALVHAAWDFTPGVANINIEGSLRLFQEARSASVRRILFISSMSAYPGARSLYGQCKMAVERAAAEYAASIIRPGLVYGKNAGGVFGSLERQVSGGVVVPMIGNGSYAQYLVHEDDVGAAVVSALRADQAPPEPVSVAHSDPWPMRELIARLAEIKGRRVHAVPIPWRAVHIALRAGELARLPLPFRSDSLLSLVFPNPHPDFNAARCLGIKPRPFPQSFGESGLCSELEEPTRSLRSAG